ncbi:hypothetical protein K7G98_33485, partial [Saccharothrix sp. MB29]|nr:hypothetical protein [Saccharothrix sp. MB29]
TAATAPAPRAAAAPANNERRDVFVFPNMIFHSRYMTECRETGAVLSSDFLDGSRATLRPQLIDNR